MNRPRPISSNKKNLRISKIIKFNEKNLISNTCHDLEVTYPCNSLSKLIIDISGITDMYLFFGSTVYICYNITRILSSKFFVIKFR